MNPTNKIKILFTIPNFETAGSGKVVYDLVNGLDKTRFDIEIACAHSGGDFFRTVETLGVKIHIFETKVHYRPYLSLLKRLQPIIQFYKENNFDIIHSWQWSSDWTEALAAKRAGRKWIYTKKAMGNNKHWKIKSFLADFIITINDEMRYYFPNKKAQKLIPLGIDTEHYNPGLFQKESKDKFKVITVANLVPVKGIEVLIHAIHSLNDPEITLEILGDDSNPYGTEMHELIKTLDMTDQAIFHGKQMDVRPYIVNSDIYVIPTLNQGRKEGMPMALVEAMSLGVTTLGSDITGINFVLKDFKDLLFPAGNIEALAEKIKFMKELDTNQRAIQGDQLRKYCIEHFAMEKFINSHEQLYRDLIYKT